jgi:amino acid adenylation domain-containing protein
MQTLLRSIVDNPDISVSELEILDGEERAQLLEFGRGDSQVFDAEELPRLHALIEASAAATPEAIAVFADDTTLTYQGLNRRANRLAHELIAGGVEPGTPVVVCFERSVAMIVAIAGVLKAGGAYVPVDPTYPTERLQYLVADSGAQYVVTDENMAGLFESTSAVPILLQPDGLAVPNSDPDTTAGPTDTNPDVYVEPEGLAYVIYTSGSTGLPKGVMVTHDNVVASTLARRVAYRRSPERFLLLSSIAFDSSVAGLFWTLSTGGTIIVPRPRQEQDVISLAALIRDRQVTHTLCIPSLYGLLLRHAASEDLKGLQAVIVAGEVCSPAVARMHGEILPTTKLYNEYGPTEATVWCTVYDVPARMDTARVPIGRPTAHTRLYVLDELQRMVPIGVPGELYVGGRGVSRGYLDRPELTAERYSPDPFDADPASRRYRTGDRVRFRSDGILEYLGRLDGQLKIRGYRIEPGEIETVLGAHPSVAEAAIIVRRDTGESDVDTGVDELTAALNALDPDEANLILSAVERNITKMPT